jgi:hypothetical protein
MTDVETLLRSQLHDRLDDVEASPMTAQRALTRGHRVQRRRTAVVAASAALALVAGGAAAVSFVERTGTSTDSVTPASGLAGRAVEYAEQFRDGNFADIRDDMTPSVRALLPESLLRSGWQQTVDESGPLTGIGPAARDPRTTHTYLVPLHFRNGDARLSVVYDDQGRIVGLRLLGPTDAEDPKVHAALGQAPGVVDDLAAEQYDRVWARFDANMRQKLPVTKLRDAWRMVAVDEHGGFVSTGGHTVRTVRGATVVDLFCTMHRGGLTVRISFDDHGDISGLFLLEP